ncbi:MAG TPA: hypothetical protein PKY30_17540, partial [Myxococcota bacterium]|nr:hypothetical protein [Myxococcota bacterium]
MIPVWEPRRLPELLAALGTAADFSPLPPPPPALLPRTMAGVAAAMGLELRPVTVRYPQLEAFLEGDGPVVVQCLDRPGLLALLRGGARPVLLRPEGGSLRLSRAELVTLLRGPLDRQAEAGLEDLTVEGRQRVLRGLLGRWDIPGFHLLRPALNRPVTT